VRNYRIGRRKNTRRSLGRCVLPYAQLIPRLRAPGQRCNGVRGKNFAIRSTGNCKYLGGQAANDGEQVR
jgi:hypothetical protein